MLDRTKGRSSKQMAKYAVVIEFPDPARVNEVRPKHREYLAALLKQGKLYATGPFVDNTGALLVYDVADEAEARQLLADDPYGQAGVVKVVSVNEWNVVLEGTAGKGSA
jgi:uncharacterized protein YciI